MDIATLGIKVESSQVRAAASDLDRLAQSGRRAERGADSVQRAARLMRQAFAGLSVGLVVREYIRMSDQFSTLSARLKLVSNSTQEFNRAQSALFDIAARTRTDVQSTSDLYVKLSTSLRDLGATQEEVLGVTETINQALQVSGANAQQAASALMQLGQGFGAGVLRGEELNSVLENSLRVAQAIADGMNVPIGQLRKLGEEGKLTASVVFEALQRSKSRVDQEFSRLPLTVGGATTQVRNAVLELVGAFDQASGASGGLASLVSDLATGIRGLAAEVRRMQADGSIARWADDARNAVEDVLDAMTLMGSALELLEKFAILGGTVQRNSVLWLFSADARKEIEDSRQAAKAALADVQASWEKLRTRQTVPRAGQAANDDFLQQPDRPKPVKTDPVAKQLISDTERYLTQLRRQIGGVYDLTAAEQLEYDIREGLLKLDGKISRARLLSAAQELDASRARKAAEEAEARAVIETIEAEQEAFRAAQEFADFLDKVQAEDADRLQRMADAWRDLIDPTRAYVRQLEEIRELVKSGDLTPAQGIAAEFEVQNRMNDEVLGDMAEPVKETNDAVKQLGLTFQSAFEDAVIGGKGFRDVLKGIEQDILRIVIRKTITEPMGNWIAGAMGGLSMRADGGPVAAGRPYLVGERGPELIVPKSSGTVVPNHELGSQSIVQNFTVNGEMSRSQEARLAVMMRNVALATMADSRRRSFA